MTYGDAAALVATINASESLPVRQGWYAETRLVRLILHPDDAVLWHGQWYAVLDHRNSTAQYLLASDADWRAWLASAMLYGPESMAMGEEDHP